MHPKPAPGQGFTLLELMIAIVVVAILSVAALPSYQGAIRKGKRADARALLQSASLAQEKYRLQHPSYASVTTALNPPCPAAGTCSSEQQHYALDAPTDVSGSSYTLTARATSASQLADTGCTALTMTVSGTTTAYAPTACWTQ